MSKYIKKPKTLTIRQQRFIEEYLKTYNACEAVRRAYPNIKTENAIYAMSGKLMVRKGKVRMAIQERLNSVLGSKEEKLALAEKVIAKLQNAFNECKVDRDIEKLGARLLEVCGVIGSGTKIGIGIKVGDKQCEGCPYNKPIFSSDMITDLPPIDITELPPLPIEPSTEQTS